MTATHSAYWFSKQLSILCKQHQLKLITAESCTGGQLAETITAIPGASSWFEGGFITYSKLSKQMMLGVSKEILENYGAVSEKTAEAMAKGILKEIPCDISLAITGIAGPDRGNEQKPIGTVCFAWIYKKIHCITETCHFNGNRLDIRHAAVKFSLKQLILLLKKHF